MFYHYAIRLVMFVFAVLIGVKMTRGRDWKDQLAAGLLFVPLLLRALGGK